MTTEQFTYWLQGFMEVANPTTLDEVQVQQIKDHLNLVFDKQTPSITISTPNWQEPHRTVPDQGLDWTWKPNPYTVTCTENDLNNPNKKFC
jgi:hypothetical protein